MLFGKIGRGKGFTMSKISRFLVVVISLTVIVVTVYFLFVTIRLTTATKLDSPVLAVGESTVLRSEEPPAEFPYYTPTKILIPEVGIELDVKTGEYDTSNQTWTLEKGAAYWANLTPKPSQNTGNTLIYAHNLPDSFYPTKYIQPGDEIYILTKEGMKLTYVYKRDMVVAPNDNSVFKEKNKPMLTLLTCSGWFSQSRRLMFADLKSISEI